MLPLASIAQKDYHQQLDRYMQALTNARGFSGVVLVMKHNDVLLKSAYGMADREWKVPNTISTRFRIGSITKQFTAACILQLEEQGKLTMDDKLSRFFPDFPKGDSVTIRMLLGHTSGIPSYTSQADFGKVERLSLPQDSMIRFISSRPYDFAPGKKFQYDNSGYFLLGCIVEKLSGQTFGSYLRQHILDKLSMSNSGLDRLDSVLDTRARGYSKRGPRYMNAPFISMEWPFSAGALYSTVEDLYKWDRALYSESILSAASRRAMFTPGMGNYGLGFFVDSVERHLRIHHGGSIPGFTGEIARYPDEDICIIALSNNEASVDFLSLALADLLFDAPVEFPYVHKEVKIDPSLLDRYVGKYSAFLTLEIIKKDGKLYRHRGGTQDIELKPEANTKFFYADDSDRQIEFEMDNSGKVLKTWFINSGQKGELKKLE
jgi:CubicO group peptidase (beta-lactamase class C family)